MYALLHAGQSIFLRRISKAGFTSSEHLGPPQAPTKAAKP